MGNIKIEEFDMKYLQDYYKEFNEDVTKYQYPDPFESLEDARELLEEFIDEVDSGVLLFTVATSETGEFIGSAEVHCLKGDISEVVVWIKRSEWGKGYGYEVLKATLDIARTQYGKKEFYYEADVRNIGSMKLLKKFEDEYDITDRGIEKTTTYSGKELELQEFVMTAR